MLVKILRLKKQRHLSDYCNKLEVLHDHGKKFSALRLQVFVAAVSQTYPSYVQSRSPSQGIGTETLE